MALRRLISRSRAGPVPKARGERPCSRVVPAYSAWVRSPVTGWTVGVGLPSVPLDRPIGRSFVMLIALGVAILGAGIVLASYSDRGIVRAHRAAAIGRPIAGARRTGAAFPVAIAEPTLGRRARRGGAILQTRMRERDEAQRKSIETARRCSSRNRPAAATRKPSAARRTNSSRRSPTNCARR